MRLLILLHRWWGVAFCLLFAMWFASGIVMHFVPFPARIQAGLATEPGAAIAGETARAFAMRYAQSRGRDAARASIGEPIDYDQWTVAGDFDSDRPLRRVALNDADGTELYLSARGGAVVLETTRLVRAFNYFGSVAHWLYPAALRHHRDAWLALVWWVSLLATVGASLGAVVGVSKLIAIRSGAPAYRGLHRWHYRAGLVCAPFLLVWIASGWLTLGDNPAFTRLHSLSFWPLTDHPLVRTLLIVALCACGFAFSLTGVVIGWRRVTGGS
jgi:PepSY-associated transmembrane protein